MKVSQKTIDMLLGVLAKAETVPRMTPVEQGHFMAEANFAAIELRLDIKYQDLVKDEE